MPTVTSSLTVRQGGSAITAKILSCIVLLCVRYATGWEEKEINKVKAPKLGKTRKFQKCFIAPSKVVGIFPHVLDLYFNSV